jgi:ceramide glucosyltransferase
MSVVALILLTSCTLWTMLGLAAVVRTTRRRKSARADLPFATLPAVTVLKPLCGADPGLRANLTSFFAQDYPNYEIVLGVEDPEDPAIAVAEELCRQHPRAEARIVVHRGSGATNPKVRNLLGMLPHARHDLLLVSDSNVRVPPHYLRDMVAHKLASPRVGLVSSLFAGRGEDTLGAALENVQLNGFCAAGATLPTTVGDAAVIGKSLLFSRAVFEHLGGFARVAHLLAEDYVMGKMFQHAGYEVRLGSTVVDNVTTHMSVGAFLRRHLRWSMLRLRLRPLAYLLEPMTSPLALLPIAWLGLGPAALPWALGLLCLRDVGGWLALRGPRRVWIPLLLAPLRELSIFLVWLYAPLERHVTWRGNRVRIGAGTLLFAPS